MLRAPDEAGGGDVRTYRVYDGTGTLTHSFEAAYATPLGWGGDEASRYLRVATDASGTDVVSVWGPNGTRIAASLDITVDGKTLALDRDSFSSNYPNLQQLTQYDFTTGGYVAIGYELTVYGTPNQGSGESNRYTLYYDTNFARIASDPRYTQSDGDQDATPGSYELADGTKVYVKWVYDEQAQQSRQLVVGADDKPITLGDYTLAISTAPNMRGNSVKHGNADLWWATDADGRWGGVDSAGNVVVAFTHDGYCDLGLTDTDYALVRDEDSWSFINVHADSVDIGQGAHVALIWNGTKYSADELAVTYAGTAIEPEVEVAIDSDTYHGTLVRGQDFTVEYRDNVDVGTAGITVSGKGSFTGELEVTFTIQQRQLSGAELTLSHKGLVDGKIAYTGEAIEPDVTVKLGDDELRAKSDYTVTYQDNTQPGIATLTVTGKGNYVGTASVSFEIVDYASDEDASAFASALTAAKVRLNEIEAAVAADPATLATEEEVAELPEGTTYYDAAAVAELRKLVGDAEAIKDVAAAGREVVAALTKDLGAATVAAEPRVVGPEPEVEPVEMMRLYNPNSGEHFYTSSTSERNNLVNEGWRYEGMGWIAPKTSNKPVYRLYNHNAGDHHYTMNESERDWLVSVGWQDEGIGWYSDEAKGTPLYRLYNPNAVAGAHHYTTAEDERDFLVSIGWHDEKIGWYGLAVSA